MTTVEEARAAVLANVTTLPVEQVDLLDALGRVLAEDMASDVDIAPFDNSAMDGYAVRAADTESASDDAPVVLRVVDHIAAGSVPTAAVEPGTASRIMTGAPVPEGADAIVMVEQTESLEAGGGTGGTVAIKRPAKLGEHIRHRGEEVVAGAVVLTKGEIIGPAAAGLLASTGHASVPVYRRPRVAILSTGDELVEVTEMPGPGKIRNSNTYSLAAQVLAAGGVPVMLGIVRDSEEATRAAFERAADEADFIISSGGVSVGDFDFVKAVLDTLGTTTFWKVNMRPGAPQTYGVIRGVPFFGLPGNPTSTYVGFEIFVRPALRVMQGFTALDRPVVRAVLAHDVKKRQDRRYYLRARLELDETAPPAGAPAYRVVLAGSQSSALLSTMHRANCFMVLPEGEAPFAAGAVVDCIRLDMEEGVA